MRLILAAAACVTVVACGPTTTMATKTILIGAVIDRTGNNAEPSWGTLAIPLAESQLNQALVRAGGLKGVALKYKVVDSMNDPATAVTRATELVRADGAKALILDSSQNSLAVNRVGYDDDAQNDLDVPIQCGGCTSGSINNPVAVDAADPVNQDTLRNAHGWLFKSIMSTKLISSLLVKIMLQSNGGDANNDGTMKIASYHSDESFGRATNTDIKAYATALHPTPAVVVDEVKHPSAADPNTYDWGADITKLTDASTGTVADVVPDFITVANFAQQQAATVRAFKNAGQTIKLLHVHTFRINSALLNLGSLADGEEGVSHVLFDGPEGEAFKTAYEAAAGTSIAYRDGLYYDIAVTYGLAALIASQGNEVDPNLLTGAQLREALLKTSDPAGEPVGPGVDALARAVTAIKEGKAINYTGASGPMDYSSSQTVKNRLVRYRVESGRFVDLAKYDCVKDDNCDLIP